MTNTISKDLQTALFDTLSQDTFISTACGGHIYDEAPAGELPEIMILIGDETVRDQSNNTSRASVHDVQIRIMSQNTAFQSVKQLSGAIQTLFRQSTINMPSGDVISVKFMRAQTLRAPAPYTRQISLIFQIFIEHTFS